ncbi:MAG TPA: alpha/beta hydrolase [Jatrophihabitans sp.]|jgi:pimeloyl-ACP methyl ester carboxylesterase|uniref:alpha/beta hydrolase n=1 Tax=Jatrophihabitans sp. TaxID=1932789 RepID=UPI002E0997F9|nr:alpha/beta hydrolase [Jatrophihabitans sp.]
MTTQTLTPHEPTTTRSGPLARVVAASMTLGLAGAATLALVVLPGASEHVVLAAMLLSFAAGWAALAGMSTRWTGRPQGWARVPAAAMAATGAALLAFSPGDQAMADLGWVWPPALLALAVWTFRAARRTLHTRARAWLVQPVCVALALAAVGGATETVLGTSDHRLDAPTGQTYDVAGHRMYLHCTGSGRPTVLLSSGLGERTPSWAWITGTVAATTRVCAYDRAGQGWSEAASSPQDGAAVAADLHATLAKAHVDGPYVLAGHSIGGIYDLIFAARYPTEVAGLVLLDSATPEQFTALPRYPGFYSMYRRATGILPVLARVGIGRLAATVQFDGLPAGARDQERAFASRAHDFNAQRDEFAELPTAFAQAKALTSLGTTPLVVVTADQGQDPGWSQAQDRLATLSTNSAHRIVHGATHEALLLDRRFAAASCRAITDTVFAARTHARVAAS